MNVGTDAVLESEVELKIGEADVSIDSSVVLTDVCTIIQGYDV